MSPSSGSFFPLFCGLGRVASSSFVLSSKERKPEGSCCATTWPFDWISFFLRILSLTSNPGYKNTTHWKYVSAFIKEGTKKCWSPPLQIKYCCNFKEWLCFIWLKHFCLNNKKKRLNCLYRIYQHLRFFQGRQVEPKINNSVLIFGVTKSTNVT